MLRTKEEGDRWGLRLSVEEVGLSVEEVGGRGWSEVGLLGMGEATHAGDDSCGVWLCLRRGLGWGSSFLGAWGLGRRERVGGIHHAGSGCGCAVVCEVVPRPRTQLSAGKQA